LFLPRVFFNPDYGIDFREGADGINLELEGADTTIFFPNEFWEQLLNEAEPEFYANVFLDFRRFSHFNKRNQLITSIRLGTILAFEERGKIFNSFRLGGHQRGSINDARAYGYNYTELEPTNFGLIGLEYQHVLFGNLFLRGGANGISTYPYVPLDQLDLINAKDFWDGTSVGYGLQASFRTRVGPFSAGVSRNTADPHFRYYFSYGFSFNYSD
jgi:NTE family protein